MEQTHSSALDAAFLHSRYMVRKKMLKLFGGSFSIFDPMGQVAFFSELKAFRLKEDIRVFTGPDRSRQLLAIAARKVLDISGVYDVTDSVTGEKIGALKRKGLRSVFLRDEWLILDQSDTEIGRVQEDSMLLAQLRRWLLNIIPQKYTGEVRGNTVFQFAQRFNPFILKLDLDFSMDSAGLLDRRLGIAAAVLLCAIEGRQN